MKQELLLLSSVLSCGVNRKPSARPSASADLPTVRFPPVSQRECVYSRRRGTLVPRRCGETKNHSSHSSNNSFHPSSRSGPESHKIGGQNDPGFAQCLIVDIQCLTVDPFTALQDFPILTLIIVCSLFPIHGKLTPCTLQHALTLAHDAPYIPEPKD